MHVMNDSAKHLPARTIEKPEIREFGTPRNGEPQISERRLFMQLHVFTQCADPRKLVVALEQTDMEAVLYLDVQDPLGVGLLLMSEDPDFFVSEARQFMTTGPFATLTPKPDWTMMGRTYSSGREPDLEDWLLSKPRRTALNPAWPWAVWYPLRRKPEFARLSGEEQGKILGEHAHLGRAYGQAGFATDIRLACYGLDARDNEFVLGLFGAELYPLSRLVQEMRKTRQTSEYIQNMGPFFVGKALWQTPQKS